MTHPVPVSAHNEAPIPSSQIPLFAHHQHHRDCEAAGRTAPTSHSFLRSKHNPLSLSMQQSLPPRNSNTTSALPQRNLSATWSLPQRNFNTSSPSLPPCSLDLRPPGLSQEPEGPRARSPLLVDSGSAHTTSLLPQQQGDPRVSPTLTQAAEARIGSAISHSLPLGLPGNKAKGSREVHRVHLTTPSW